MNVKRVTKSQQRRLIESGIKQCYYCLTVKEFDCFDSHPHCMAGKSNKCKSCTSKKNKIFRETRKEKEPDFQKKAYLRNRESIREKQREYYQNNRQKVTEINSRWAKSDAGIISDRKAGAKYRSKNKEKIREKSKQYRENNRHKCNELAARRRARVRSLTPENADLELIKLIYKACPEGYHVDHIIPIARGGLHHESNLAYLPGRVNDSKGAKTPEEYPEFYKHALYPLFSALKGINH